MAEAGALETVRDSSAVSDRLSAMTEGLTTVTDVVAGLDIGDATVRTSILERIAEVLGGANRARATLDGRRRELLSKEGRAEFAAEFALLGQAVTGALAAAGTPESCDDQLARLLLQLENLESRFAEFDDFLAELAERRTEVYEAFSARKQTLQDERARRAERLAGSAGRVLETIARRVSSLEDLDAVHTYFASDPMVAKVRRTADELRELGDPVRAEELDGRLKAARQEAGRALRDRTELYADGGSVIRLGRHRFAVNTQPFDLTLVPSGEGLVFALTGTDYRAPVTDPAFAAARPYGEQLLPSENAAVYRAEHLAARLLDEHGAVRLGSLPEAELRRLVRESAAEAYDEGYTRGVHDEDAAAILAALLRLHAEAGLLRHRSAVRAAAQHFWAYDADEPLRTSWSRRAVSLARARDTFGSAPAIARLREEWAAAIGSPSPAAPGHAVAAYLFEELTTGPAGFVVGSSVRAFLAAFHRAVGPDAYAEDLAALGDDRAARRQLVEGWLAPYAETTGAGLGDGDLAEAVAVEPALSWSGTRATRRSPSAWRACSATTRAWRAGPSPYGSTNSWPGRPSSATSPCPASAPTSGCAPPW
ncbi:DNA repair ATPase OS=Streptomyces griseus subsp. griseus (strain JCM 4626 / NBRC) OX=455632 GN=SGR_3811 PE=4 SV=1 [Streptomyces griseus subsp. griseus]